MFFRVPNKLVVLWQRGAHRRRYSRPFDFQPGIAKPYRGVMVWAEAEELDMTCTLYRVCIMFNFSHHSIIKEKARSKINEICLHFLALLLLLVNILSFYHRMKNQTRRLSQKNGHSSF